MFGKRVGDYLGFQKVFLALMAAVGLARLVVSLAGAPDAQAQWLSMTAVALAGALYYGVAVHTRGFGGYKQLLPLVLFQGLLLNGIAVLGILLAIAGRRNIYGVSEYSGPFGERQWPHVLGHMTIGVIVPTLITWGIACLVLLITKRVARRPLPA
jgi:hypothetical protein